MKRTAADIATTPRLQRHEFVTSALFPGDEFFAASLMPQEYFDDGHIIESAIPQGTVGASVEKAGGGAADAAAAAPVMARGGAMLASRATVTDLTALADWEPAPDDEDNEEATRQAEAAGGFRCNDEIDVQTVARLPADIQQRLSTFVLIRNGSWPLDPCRFYKNFTAMEPIRKPGVSTTFVFTAKLRVPQSLARERVEPNVVVKVGFEAKRPEYDDSLRVERDIYRLVINSLLIDQYTAHVVLYYGQFKCNRFYTLMKAYADKLGDVDAAFFRDELERFRDKEVYKNGRLYIRDNMRALMTEGVRSGTTLYDLLSSHAEDELTLEEQRDQFDTLFRPILFQLLYTLQVFAEVGLQHNDMHVRNILIEKYRGDMRDYTYELDPDTRFMLRTDMEVRIFDFDRAIKTPTRYNACRIDNVALSQRYLCQSYGQCQQFDARIDLFLILRQFLYYAGYNRYVREFVRRHLPADLIERGHKHKLGQFSHLGSLCVCGDAKCRECTMLRDVRIPSARSVLLDEAFAEYRWRSSDGNWPTGGHYWRLPSAAQ